MNLYLERLKSYLETLPEGERESARAGIAHAARFVADELGTWRRSQKETGAPELPDLDARHVVSLHVLMRAFGPR